MNTRRAVILILIAGLLGLHTVYTRQSELDYSLRTGQLYASVDRLTEEKLELEVNLSILRQPVTAARLASRHCPELGPACPELAAYQLAQDVPQIQVPSLRERQAREAALHPPTVVADGHAPLESPGGRHSLDAPAPAEILPAPAGRLSNVSAPAANDIPAPVTAPSRAVAITPPVVTGTPVRTPPPSSAAAIVSAPVPQLVLPPIDTDDPDAEDAPQPVLWPEEPADDAPVFGYRMTLSEDAHG